MLISLSCNIHLKFISYLTSITNWEISCEQRSRLPKPNLSWLLRRFVTPLFVHVPDLEKCFKLPTFSFLFFLSLSLSLLMWNGELFILHMYQGDLYEADSRHLIFQQTYCTPVFCSNICYECVMHNMQWWVFQWLDHILFE